MMRDALVTQVGTTDGTLDQTELVVAEALNHPAHPRYGGVLR